MSGKMHHQTVDLIAPENYSSALKGTVNASSDKSRLTEGFLGSPILNGTYDPKKTFVNLVLKSKVFDPSGDKSIGLGHWGLSDDFSRDYPAPNLEDVVVVEAGGPGSPYTPNAVSSAEGGISTGTGQETVVDPAAEKSSRAPFVGHSADTASAQPATTSEIHRDTTLNMFKEDVPTAVMGSNTAPPPTSIEA